MTVTLSPEIHRALKEASARRGRSMGGLIEESLAFYGIKSRESALELVARARAEAGLSEDEAMRIAVDETRAVRRR